MHLTKWQRHENNDNEFLLNTNCKKKRIRKHTVCQNRGPYSVSAVSPGNQHGEEFFLLTQPTLSPMTLYTEDFITFTANNAMQYWFSEKEKQKLGRQSPRKSMRGLGSVVGCGKEGNIETQS